MLASDEAALPVAGVAVGVIGRLTKDVDPFSPNGGGDLVTTINKARAAAFALTSA
jgi:hypothetical protein